MVILGPKTVQKSISQGQFRCPQCREMTRYEQISVRRFFVLFDLPLFPLGGSSEALQCGSCLSDTGPEFLSDPASSRSDLSEAKLRVMVAVMMADGKMEDDEITTIQRVFQKLAKEELSKAEVAQEARLLMEKPESVQGMLRAIGPSLSDEQKANIIKAAAYIAQSDDDIDPTEVAVLKESAASLSITDAEYSKIMAAFIAQITGR